MANATLKIKKTETELALRDINSRFALGEFILRERNLLDLSDEDRDVEAATMLEHLDGLELHRKREIIRSTVSITVNRGRVDSRVVIFARASQTRTAGDPRQAHVARRALRAAVRVGQDPYPTPDQSSR